jgi:hypothetical protein
MKENSIRVSPAVKSTAPQVRLISLAAVMLLVLIGGSFAWRAWKSQRVAVPSSKVETISAAELEERYGMRLRLVAVTAGGGLVDFRLKILDAEKAAQLLASPDHTPTLIVPGTDVALSAPRPAEGNQDLRLKDDDVFIALIPNSDSVVKPGTAVVVTFGDLQLDQPVQAQ